MKIGNNYSPREMLIVAGTVALPLKKGLPVTVRESKIVTDAAYTKGINSTIIGAFSKTYHHPGLHLPGSDGAADISALCGNTPLIQLFLGVTVDAVKKEIRFECAATHDLSRMRPPTNTELVFLRGDIEPTRKMIKKESKWNSIRLLL